MKRSPMAPWIVTGTLLGTACSPPGEPQSTSSSPEVPVVLSVAPDLAPGEIGTERSVGALNRALSSLRGPVEVRLRPGTYHLEPGPFTDPACGDCEKPDQAVNGTVGLHVSGTGIVISGTHRDSVVIRTGAGYGILFDECQGCALRNVTVTGGVRNPDPLESNGAVVARSSSVTLQRCRIEDNVGEPDVIQKSGAGIAGVVGRENSELRVLTCRIEGNSGDGIALYRDAKAVIRGNTIDGAQAAEEELIGAGRGTGIEIAGNAEAVVEENLIRRYWRGIGLFGEAAAQVRENVVEEVATWGIAIRSDRARTSFVERNVVFRTGACGILVDAKESGREPGSVSRNLLVETGVNSSYDAGTRHCPQEPLARIRVPTGWDLEENVFHDNRRPGPPGDAELDLEAFIERTMRLYTFEIEPQAATHRSAFIQAYAEAYGPPFR